MHHFVHSGKLGDIIYALPTIRAMGGGWLSIVPSEPIAEEFTKDDYETIRPLLEIQPYITAVDCAERVEPPVVNLNYWRFYEGRVGKNLAEYVLGRFGQDLAAANSAWLTVKPARRAAVVFSRTLNYQGIFPWLECVRRFPDALFVGNKPEWEAFRSKFGEVRFLETGDLLELAEVIAGADLFVGNQSCPLAIAEGLKKRVMVEVCLGRWDNCRFSREGAIYISDGQFREFDQLKG